MARRSDHTRPELAQMIVDQGHRLMAEQGYARFSAREVAKRIGYSIGTIYNVFGTLDRLIVAINTRTFVAWTAHLAGVLAIDPSDRIAALVAGYFAFARTHPHLWTAIYDHRLPAGMTMPDADAGERAALTTIVVAEVARALGTPIDPATTALARSLIATVHGHCSFALTGAFALMGEDDPEAAALARVRETIAAHRG